MFLQINCKSIAQSAKGKQLVFQSNFSLVTGESLT